MAIVLPVFLLVCFAILEFARAMSISNLVTNAAREGARLAVLDGSSNTQVEQAVINSLVAAASLNSGDISVAVTVTAASGNPDPANQCGSAKSRDLINVNVQIPFNEVALVPGKYLSGITLTGRSAMRHE
jgi:Flp pilus assembly protein TadG